MKNIHAVVLAAGVGVRFKSAKPKLLHTVAGKEIIRHVIDNIKAADIDAITVVAGAFLKDIQRVIGPGVSFVRQPQVSGTGDAVKRALPSLKKTDQDVLILCGDTPLIDAAILKQLVSYHHKKKSELTILSAVIENDHAQYGRIMRDDSGKVVEIREEKGTKKFIGKREVNAGAYCIKKNTLQKVLQNIKRNRFSQEFYFTDAVKILVQQDVPVFAWALEREDEIIGINTRVDLARAASFLQRKMNQWYMEQGVTLVHPETIYIDTDVIIGKDTIIKPYTYIERHTTIGERCIIGPFCHIRPYTQIADEVHLGNFVEIKKSCIGSRSKINHLTYVGDSDIGCDVNLGAGTITANYDGTYKYKTTVKDEVFTGCNTVLIAPVTLGKRAVTGAGAVVCRGHHVPSGATVVGVPARVVKKGSLRKRV